MSRFNLDKRAVKLATRKHLELEHAKTRGLAVTAYSVIARGFWGRLKWLLRGR